MTAALPNAIIFRQFQRYVNIRGIIGDSWLITMFGLLLSIESIFIGIYIYIKVFRYVSSYP